MEALFFRDLARELPPLLVGRRLEQIHAPRPGWFTLRLQTSAHPRFLLFAHHPAVPALGLFTHRPDNPPVPTGQVMGLRKRLQGLRILSVHADWSTRKLALHLGPAPVDTWLILDARKGVSLRNTPLGQDHAPAWPELSEVLENPNIWQEYAFISPLLRKTLTLLPETSRADLYVSLKNAPAAEYFIYSKNNAPHALCPWVLPPQMSRGLHVTSFSSALDSATAYARQIFFPSMPTAPANADIQAAKRQVRLLQRLEADKKRMTDFCLLADQARLLQNNLYRLSGHARQPQVSIMDQQGQSNVLALDPRKTILENMEHWFRLADKGKRGLIHIRNRRAEIMSGMDCVAPAGPTALPRPPRRGQNRSAQATQDAGLPVHRFLSSDGFNIWRGKNQKANHALLTKLAGPADYWFHAEDGPGAHVILKRDHPGQAVPEQSLREAAILAGLASHFCVAGRASIICAEVRHVRAVKGSPGLARVDQRLRTLLVDLDPELEKRLKQSRFEE